MSLPLSLASLFNLTTTKPTAPFPPFMTGLRPSRSKNTRYGGTTMRWPRLLRRGSVDTDDEKVVFDFVKDVDDEDDERALGCRREREADVWRTRLGVDLL